MILLDATFIIDYLRGDTSALEALDVHAKEGFCITDMVTYEVAQGILFAQEKRKEKKLGLFIDFISQFNILPMMNLFAMDAARISARLHLAGRPVGTTDCLIAGIMHANGVKKILTRNEKHFRRIKEIEVVSY